MNKEKNLVCTRCRTAADTGRPFENIEFETGEIYLFHKTDPDCPDGDALWAVFDSRDVNGIMLESCTDNLIDFTLRCRLPADYRYCRLSTESEVREYAVALAMFEIEREPIPKTSPFRIVRNDSRRR